MVELRRRVTAVHIEAINLQLQDMSCPTFQKLELIDSMMDELRKEDKNA